MARVVIMLGAPGAGKGTQATRLSRARSLPHISTGDLFRENVAGETDLGKRAKRFMDSGELVSDELVLDMLFERVARDDCRVGYLLDGFPRTLPQAAAFDARMGPADTLEVLRLAVSDSVITERVGGRLLCRSGGHIQHAKFQPPAKAGICDTCGGELYQRADDQPDVVRERLRVYHEQTAPLEKLYAERNVMKTVDGELPPDEVHAELERLCP